MPLHMGIPPDGLPTLEEAGCREAEAWDAMLDAMLDEHLERYLEGLEADSLAHMLQDHVRRARQPPQKRPNGVQVSHFRQPRYQFARDNALFASRWRADWSATLAWEHVGAEDVLANPQQEFENLTRLPRTLFDELVLCAARSRLWTVSKEEPVAQEDGVRPYQKVTPLSLRILAVLRHLATGESWQSLFMATKISRPTLQAFYHEFMPWFILTHYEEWVTGPSGIGFGSVAEVEVSERIFRQMGLPGIITSMDGVHCQWDRAHERIRYQFVGKEGYPTIGWNVHVLANGKIVYIAPTQPGATNDKTFARHDELIHAIRTQDVFTTRLWGVHTRLVGRATLAGCASLCDNGWHPDWCAVAGVVDTEVDPGFHPPPPRRQHPAHARPLRQWYLHPHPQLRAPWLSRAPRASHTPSARVRVVQAARRRNKKHASPSS